MADLQLLDCFQPELVNLERVHYFPRQLLTAEDMTADQDYFRQKLRRHNRFLHGWGPVCGLEVTAAGAGGPPWGVQISAGYALGPYGDEIYVAEPVSLDLAQCGPGAATSPCEPDMLLSPGAVTGGTLYVAIKYAECVALPVRAMPAGCACEEIHCEYSRIRDSFEIGCLTDPLPGPEVPLLCDLIRERKIVPCPPCPTEPWVVLARVELPAPGTKLSDDRIDNSVRRQLYSTAVLQQQLIECCCNGQRPPQPVPVRVTRIDPANGEDRLVEGAQASLTIVVTFDKSLQVASVSTSSIHVAGFRENVLVPDAVQSPAVSYDESTRSAAFTGLFRAGLRYVVTVRGDQPSPIIDVDGLALDGDADAMRTPGGNFISEFTVTRVPA